MKEIAQRLGKNSQKTGVIPPSRVQLNRSGLPFETLKCGPLERAESAGSSDVWSPVSEFLLFGGFVA